MNWLTFMYYVIMYLCNAKTKMASVHASSNEESLEHSSKAELGWHFLATKNINKLNSRRKSQHCSIARNEPK